MSGLQQAIDEFRQERLKVYRIAPDQITRDANSANETARDHVGRWIYELIQNSDDAEASQLLVRVTDGAIYVADNGKGLAPATIKSLSGTHLSVKPAGAIGRKGLGFKSVYAITRTPHIFSDQDGMVFCPGRSVAWLREQGFATSKVPYQWLPFWLSRRADEQGDEVLASLREMRTVVKLPLANPLVAAEVVESLRALPAYVLLTFRHLRQLSVVANEADKSFSVRMTPWPDIETEWSITDTRQGQTQHWRLAKVPLNPPPEALVEFEDDDDRRRAAEVSVAVATLLDAQRQVTPLSGPMMLHVYYRTEEPSPIPVLLHADFVVKSDRTRIVPHSRFNAWLSGSLASHVVYCVEQWYSDSAPAANLRLLLPTGDFASSDIATDLWEHIEARAKSVLKLPDASGNRVLAINTACRVGTSVAPELARPIFAKCGYASRLVHPSLEKDTHGRRVLDKLGCAKLTDDDLFAVIASAPQKIAGEADWLWGCWHWIAAWAAAQREQDLKPDARNTRLSRLRKTPILAVGARTVSLESLAGKIVTWRDATLQFVVPEWMPLLFVDDWLRNRLLSAAADSLVRLLLTELGVEAPSQKLLLKALAHAIADFWKTKQGAPSRFIAFLAASNFHDQFEASETLQRFPIMATIEGRPGEFFVEAHRAHFGREWGGNLLSELYDGVQGIAWAKRPDENTENHRAMLTWLGVREYPRLVRAQNEGGDSHEGYRVRMRLPNCTSVGEILAREALDSVDFAKLSQAKTAALLRLLVRHWHYYASHVNLSVSYKYRTWNYASVPAAWWEELKAKLVPPRLENDAPSAPLQGCWLPDKPMRRAVGSLFPTINLDSFGDDRSAIESWLIQHVGVRTQLSQIRPDEWRELFRNRIPEVVPAAEAALDGAHQKVAGWYEACLESLSAQESDSPLANVPLLCRKGEAWAYVVQESRWLADDNELAEAFSVDVWQIAFPERLHADARKYFGLTPLSDAEVQPRWDSTTGQAHAELQAKLDSVKPYVFVWRCYKTKQDHEQLCTFLQSLCVRVADLLEANVTLGDSMPAKVVERQAEVAGDVLLLNREKAGLPLLAEAIARAVRTPTDADFYENLLRCEGDTERIRKLEARNCPTEQIQRLAREYRTSAEPQTADTITSKTEPDSQRQQTPATSSPSTNSTETNKTQQPVSGSGAWQPHAEVEPKELTTTSEQPVSPTHAPSEDTTVQGAPPKTSSGQIQHGSESGEGRAQQLKEAGKEKPEVKAGHARERRKRREERKATTARPEEQSQSETEREIGFESLTPAAKAELDRRAKEFAAIELKKPELGYKHVQQMSDQSPGYDLRAEKDGETLRVEVKGHLKAATKVFVTKREWKEYSCQTPENRWELWNVEFLAADVGQPVRITRYDRIPTHAIEVGGLWIELADCSLEADK